MAKLKFNREPYFDDFDESKNFYQILFRPKRAIQTRELNQLQTILSHQTELFANHIFKFGSMVKSGSIRYKNYTPYVRLKDLTPKNEAVDVSRIDRRKVRGKTSGLLAEVILTSPKDEFDPATIFVNYLNTAIDGETKAFVNGETLEVLDDKGYVVYEVVVRCPDCVTNPDADTIEPTGFGSLFAVEPSVYYVYGKFVPIDYQIIILDKYSTTPSYKIGFDIGQSIVQSDDDISLNDNALGTPNFTAPGADRYRIKLVLIKKPLSDENDENFVLLAKVDGGYLQEIRDKPQYAELMNTLARRTYDESGDYTVKPFRISFKEHLKSDSTSTNGWKTAEDGGDESKFVVVVTPGKAYVRGREIEVISDRVVPVDKARDSEKKRSSVIRPYHGNYILIKLDSSSNFIPDTNMTDGINASDFEVITLYDGAASGGVPTGNFVGTLRAKSIELYSGVAGDVDAVYKLYVWDMKLEAGKKFSDVLSLSHTGGGSQTFVANVEPDPIDGVGKVYKPDYNTLLFKLPYEFTKSIRDADNPLVSNTSITIYKKMVGAVNNDGKAIFLAEGDETFLNYHPKKWIGALQETPGGNYIPFDLTQPDVIVATPSQIEVVVGTAHTGKNFSLVAEVMVSNAKEKQKVLDTKYLTNIPGDVSEISLQVADVWKVKSVIDITSGDPATYVDVTDNYILDNGIRDNGYFISKLILKKGLPVPDPGTILNIEVEYFQHVGSGKYFSVDSYTSIINDPSVDFTYEDIPVYTDQKGVEYRMSDTLDFRPTVGSDGTFTGPNSSITSIPVDQSNIIFDLEYYLPRVDTLCLDENGKFIAVRGIPSLNPVAPPAAEKSMPIYNIHIDAYTFDVTKNIRQTYIDNKRYTMKDIGKLDKRISNLEYYVTFNLLEKATADMTILDANGKNMFKNGFLVDNFKDFVASDTKNPEYRVSLDTNKGELRPSFISRAVKVALDETASSHYKVSSKVVTLPFESKLWMEQPFATKTVSVNPYFIYEQIGKLVLNPSTDVWKDVETEPALVVNVDTGWEALRDVANAAGILGTTWNSWETTSQTTDVDVTTIIGASGGSRTTTTTTTSQQERTGINRTIETEVTNRSLGTYVTSVNIIPYCRSIPVQFAAANLRPRTKLYAFFDGVDVTEDCRPLNGTNSHDLVSDENGELVGVFTIPNRPNKRFFTGTRIFRLTNSPTDSRDPDELTTSAEAQFFAGGLQETRRETVLSVTTPRLIENEVSQQRTVTTISTTTTTWIRSFGDDPLAQSFLVAEEDGVFLTGIDIYFSSKPSNPDDTTPVWVQIRNMVNGYPGPVIVPFSEVTKRPEDVEISVDGTRGTHFEFEAPVYLQPDEEYCFVVGSSSEEYRIFVSKLGGQTLGSNPVTISSQPHLGSMFKSQNDSTWTAEQYEDIKFKLYRADFDISQKMDVSFSNVDFGLKTALPDNPLETEAGSRMVRVYMKNHGLNPNDKVKLEFLQDTWYTVHLQSGNLVVGQEIQGVSNMGTAVIKNLIHDGLDGAGNNVYRVQLANLKGFFADNEQFNGLVYYENFTNTELLNSLGIKPKPLTHNVAIGTFPTGVDNTFNGIPLSDLSTPEHLVQHVDSMDSFIIQVDTPATESGRVGGTGAYAVGNIQIDAFDLQINYIDYTGEAAWSVSGVKHAAVGSNVTDYESIGPITFEPNVTNLLEYPMKIANEINEEMYLGAGNKSITLNVKMDSKNSFISPIINLDNISFTCVTNRIEWNTCENYSVEPLATVDGQPLVCDPEDPAYNARWITEESNDAGVEGAKYIMKPVTLDNPATNIRVYMQVLKYIDNDIIMYYRTLPSDVEDSIESQNWTKTEFNFDVISEHDSDYKEVEISIPNDIIDVLPEFKAFQIKLVLKAKNTAKPPKIKNFRAIAVT